MNLSDIIAIMGALVALASAIHAGRTVLAQSRKATADTASVYQEIAQKCAEAQREMREQLDALSKRLDDKDQQIAALEALLHIKDARIDELERLTTEQAGELDDLRREVEELRSKKRK